MNEEIKSIFNNFKVNDKKIEVEHLRYTGNKKTFITWTIINEYPSLICDDENIYSVVEVDIDIFSNGNYLDIVKEIKKVMKNNNWNWVEDSSEMYEEETELYHKVITFKKERFEDNG